MQYYIIDIEGCVVDMYKSFYLVLEGKKQLLKYTFCLCAVLLAQLVLETDDSGAHVVLYSTRSGFPCHQQVSNSCSLAQTAQSRKTKTL